MATPAPGVSYPGPQCPFCDVALIENDIRTGTITCGSCQRDFEATAFTPPQKRLRIVEVAVSGPEGANACANHARNAAVTSCERCGLFICSLCEMNVGEGSFCPSCFQRARVDGTLQSANAGRIRDYGSMARLTLVLGWFLVTFLGIPFGALGIYYAVKAIKQRREYGDPVAGMYVAIVFGVLEVLGSLAFIGFMIYGAMQ